MYLVGTIHLDLEGPRRLRYFLESCRPKTITIEFPRGWGILEAERRLKSLSQKRMEDIERSSIPEPCKLLGKELTAALCYEVIVPIEYAKSSGASVHFIDHPDIMQSDLLGVEIDFVESFRQSIGNVPEDITYRELRSEVVSFVDGGYRDSQVWKDFQLSMSFQSLQKLEAATIKLRDKQFQEEREHTLADNCLSIKPEAHIGGMDHIFGGFDFLTVKPFYERLGEIKYTPVRLCDVDSRTV